MAQRACDVSFSPDCAFSPRRGSEFTGASVAVVAAKAALEIAMKWEHDQECARSDAEATGIDLWGAAARERLHEAIRSVRQARANLLAAQAAQHACIESA